MTTCDEAAVRRACLLHAGAIGDFVLSLRIVASLRERWPQAEICVVGHESTARLAVGRGGVDLAVSQERLRLHTLYADASPPGPACAELLGTFQVIVNMVSDADDVFTRRLGEVSRALIVTIDPAARDSARHVTEAWLDDLRAAGIPTSSAPPRLTFSPEERGEGLARLVRATGRGTSAFVVIHPGSGGRRKCWPAECFIRLAEGLGDRGLAPVFMLGPVELEQHGAALRDRLEAVCPVLVEADLVEAAKVVAAGKVFVGNDAGMTHVAAACGTPTVAIFGATDPVVWRPLGDVVRVLVGDPPGTFDGVTVERAGDAVGDLMGA
ncbi:MAG: glycosyltransferase family 9 protein [Phycisphaerae bacterium]|nr:glycosyltransferase family 9 protein [Phycisphaerae bacterium]